MSKEDLQNMFALGSAFAEKMIAMKGRVNPMWHCITASGEHLILPPPPTDKDSAAILLRALFELRDVVTCMYIDEAYTVEATGDQAEKLLAWFGDHGNIKAFPDRIEAVMFMGEDAQAGCMGAHREIIRRRGKVRLGPLKIHNLEGVVSEGRLVGMLPRRNATVQ